MPHAHLLAGLCLAVMTLPACQGSASSLEAPPSALSPSPTVARPFGPQDDGLSTTAQEPAFTDSPVDGSGQDMTPTGGGQVATPAVPEFSRIYYVATDGSDNAVGSSSAPFRTVERAAQMVKAGEAIFVRGGSYSERIHLGSGVRDGQAEAFITLRAAPGSKPVFKGGTGSALPMLTVEKSFWRVEGITFDVAKDKAFAALFRTAGSRFNILRNCVLKNGTAGAGVNVAESASDVLIEKCEISHFSSGERDSHGVVVQTTAKNVTVRANDIHHNSGDSVQCLGPEGGATIAGTPFDNLLVEGNRLHENRENGVDVKTCSRVTLRNNVIFGHRRSSSSGGEGIVIHLSARQVLVEGNQLYDNGRGISVGGVRVNAPPTDITLRRNRIWSGRDGAGEDGCGIRIDTSSQVKVVNNTIFGMPGSALLVGYGDTGNSDAVEVSNNIFADSAAMVQLGASRSKTVFARNLFYNAGGEPVFEVTGRAVPYAQWLEQAGESVGSIEASPLFSDAQVADFTLQPGSPAMDQGLDLGDEFCGNAPDLGALESDCG